MEYITLQGATGAALLRQVEYTHKHAGQPHHTCQVKGCPQQGMVSLGNGSSLCAWHDIAWRVFLDNWREATGKHVRLGRFGNWHIRLREFMAWAEKNPKDRTFLPGQAIPKDGEAYDLWSAL